MTAILSVFWRICIFRSGPDVVPTNSILLGLVILANALTGIIAWSILEPVIPTPPPDETAEVAIVSDSLSIVTRAAVSLASTSVLVWLILTLMGFGARFNKTLTALFGTDILITAVATLVIFATMLMSPILGQIAILGWYFWTIGVFGFILHRALEISIGFGIAAAIFVMVFTIAITDVTTTPTP